jgi:hypothetical protein
MTSAGSSSVVVFVFGVLISIFFLNHLRRGHLQYPTDERAPVPLSIHHTPLCVTFAYLEG